MISLFFFKMSNEVPICTFYWTFQTNMCKYKLPQLSNGPQPPANRGCTITSASAKIIPPSPPRTEPSPVTCFGIFPDYNSRSINDPDNCSGCRGFRGYPDSWPPRTSGDSRYGPSNTTWKATGQEKQGSDFSYLVEWTLTERCGSSRPRTRKTTIKYTSKWIIQNGISTTTGYTVVDCGRTPPPPPPPPPTS